jgi:hypothetical protein
MIYRDANILIYNNRPIKNLKIVLLLRKLVDGYYVERGGARCDDWFASYLSSCCICIVIIYCDILIKFVVLFLTTA